MVVTPLLQLQIKSFPKYFLNLRWKLGFLLAIWQRLQVLHVRKAFAPVREQYNI